MELDKIDTGITVQLDKVKNLFSKSNFTEVKEFKLSDITEDLKITDTDFKGLYFFEIQNNGEYKEYGQWINQFIKPWNKQTYKRKKIPLLYPGRYNKHSGPIEPNEWIPLYIGKSKKVAHRVNQHIFLDINSATYAMKLKAHTELAEETFRVSILKVDVTNYDTIVPVVESTLRDEINPIVGKQ